MKSDLEEHMFTKKKLTGLLILCSCAVLLAACSAKPTEDPNLKITQIAATVQSELTQNALLTPSATATPEPTATPTMEPPTPTVEVVLTTAAPTQQPTTPNITTGDNSLFKGDVNYPDGTVVPPGTTFTKTWRFQNTGKTTWTKDYEIRYLQGVLQGTNGVVSFKLTKDVAPGEIAEISAQFTAPAAAGRYTSMWKLYSASGYWFGEFASIDIVVGDVTAQPTTEGTVSPTPEPTSETPVPTP